MNTKMQQGYVASKKKATCFATIGGNRYDIFFARNFEGKVNMKTTAVPMLDRPMDGRKVEGAEGKFKLTIYRLTDKFSEMIMEYLKTGILPELELQVTEEDNATPLGRSTKIYRGCVIDGEVLLSVLDDTGGFIEQTIEGYYTDVAMPETYADPAGM